MENIKKNFKAIDYFFFFSIKKFLKILLKLMSLEHLLSFLIIYEKFNQFVKIFYIIQWLHWKMKD